MFESPIACNEALDQHYKAICWAGKSGGIEALNQALQCPHILARVRDIDFRLLESRGISRKTSYGNGESGAGFRGKRTQHRGTGLEIDSVGGNSARNCFLPPRPTGIWQHNGNPATRLNSSTLQHYKDSAEKYCWNQICPKYLTNHGSVTANGPTGLIDLLYGLERESLELKRLKRATRVDYDRLKRTT
ncbi:hypothetical protein R3P38DRAFT_2792255 [Favolaschia claudopus]|uniref:Uncharacterized protein n=1 Tax=Favolaschia claudopus TaxID=2862362 RepID=A0AAW0AFB2_9AGAR